MISPSISARDITSALRTTGTMSPLGELTAIHISAYSWKIASFPSIIALTPGNLARAMVTAFVKKPMKPNPTPFSSLNLFLYFFLRSIMGFISTSLKVVSIAVSFFTPTSLSATFLRSIDMRSVRVSREPVHPAFAKAEFGSNPAARADNTSCLRIRPSLPDPERDPVEIPLSAIILRAAGDV